MSDRRAFVQEYLATLHDEPPAPTKVNALVNDIQYFTVCDNYLRGFELVERAHAAAKDVDAAGLLSKAAMRLRQARARIRRGLVMCRYQGRLVAAIFLLVSCSFASCRWHS